MEREFKRLLGQLPREKKAHSPTLRRLQKLSKDCRERQCKREKKKLHYALVKGAKIKSAINKALNPTQTAPIHILDRSADPPVIETNPSRVGKRFSNCLSDLGGDPHFVVNQQLLNQFIQNLPKCPGGTASAPLDMPALTWLQNITGRSKPTKSTGEDEINYYIVSLLPPSLQRFLLSAIHYILLNAPPPEWSRVRVCLLYKKGDKTDPANYRPICLIQTLVKLAAAWQCEQVTALTPQHRLIHPCQCGGVKNHRCGYHIYDVVSRMLRSKGRLHHLYIDFNKAENSVPLHALWTTLRGYGLPEALISSVQRLYDNATDQPLINGSTTEGHPQLRWVRQGCSLSPLLFNLYLNLMFFGLDGEIEWGLGKSIHASIDDILFRAMLVEDIKTVYKAFDGPARMLGLDLNLSKTELHAVRGVGHTVVRSCHSGTFPTRDQIGSPPQVYKYLGVYFYTSDHSTQVYDCMRAQINAFYARLAPVELTASELIMLTNKQLLPMVAYRLLAGPVPDKQLYAVQQLIWAKISSYGKLPRLLSPRDRYGPRAEGGLCITPVLHFMRSQIYNYGLWYLNSDGQSQSNESVRLALTALATNWLQESFVDSVHALGGRCHGFGPWNPCPVKRLCCGKEIHVEFNSGWFSGPVLTYDENRASALIRFHVDSTEFHVTDRHTFSLHPAALLRSLQAGAAWVRWREGGRLSSPNFPLVQGQALLHA